MDGRWHCSPPQAFATDTVSRTTYYAVYTFGTGSCIIRDSVVGGFGGEVNAGPDLTYCDNVVADTLIALSPGLNGSWSDQVSAIH
ncbi:MAG: hypothetical protein IPK10_00845 [Bacteroidetes bacterium]|nr:hypothetical protein [Bacteroidota bacterium]